MHRRRKRPADPKGSGSAGFSGWGVLGVLCLVHVVVILGCLSVSGALPDLGGDLRIGRSGLSWTITSYSLVFGSLLLLGGRAADLIGRRQVFLAGLTVFTAASVGSARAGSSGALFAARAGQGLGAALLSPAALSIITTQFQGLER